MFVHDTFIMHIRSGVGSRGDGGVAGELSSGNPKMFITCRQICYEKIGGKTKGAISQAVGESGGEGRRREEKAAEK